MAHFPSFINPDAPYGTPPPPTNDHLSTSPPSPDKTPGGSHPRYVSSPRFLAQNRLDLKRTQEEIVAKCSSDAFLDFTSEVLSDYLEWQHARAFYKDEYVAKVDSGETAAPDPLIPPLIAAQDMLDYLVFGYSKALDERGISASRTISKLAAWAWLLGRDDLETLLKEDARYSPYGMPALIAFAEALGCVVPDECYTFAGMDNPDRTDVPDRVDVLHVHVIKGRNHPVELVPEAYFDAEAHLDPTAFSFIGDGLDPEYAAKLGKLVGMDPAIFERPNTMDPLSEPRPPDFFAHSNDALDAAALALHALAQPPSPPAETDEIVKRVLGESAYVGMVDTYGLQPASPSNNYESPDRPD